MIDSFHKQNIKSVWSLLECLGRTLRVYATKCTGVFPSLGNKEVYLYATKNEVVILCMDIVPENSLELANEVAQVREGKRPQYISIHDNKVRRDSTVWQMQEAAHYFLYALSCAQYPTCPQILCVLLTNGRILNYYSIQEDWALLPYAVKMLPGLTDIREHTLLINEKGYAEGAKMVNTALEEIRHMEYLSDSAAFKYLAGLVKVSAFVKDKKEEEVYVDSDNYDELDDDDEDNLDSMLLESAKEALSRQQNNAIKAEVLEPIANPRQELDKLVGCANIKRQIGDLLELTEYNCWMHLCYPEWKRHEVSLHAIFFGRPGTGKTTVCKIYGSLLKEAHVLSRGHVVVCGRGTFLGNNWGDEEKAVRQVLEMARGGVLMIDEAYLLNSSHQNDPGKLVVQLLMETLADEAQRDIAIVLCGYKEPMQRLLDLNPGLASRFPNRYEFEDFSINDLLEITRRRIREHDYHFTRAAWAKYKILLAEAYAGRDPQIWGNARFIANQLEHIYLLHAKRCVQRKFPKMKAFFSITPADIEPIDVPKAKRHVGF